MVIANSRDCCNKSRNPDAACRGRRQCPHHGRSGCLRRFHTSSLRSSTAQVGASSAQRSKVQPTRMIEPDVVPVAGRNGILDAATVEWKTPYGHSTCRRIDDLMDAWKKAGASGLLVLVTDRAPQKSMPPIPPMPPPAPPGMAEPCFFGSSATIASVVISRPAIEAAPCRATRTTFVGSMMPFETKLPYSPVCAS
jgi:hypothetical protein